MARSTSTSIPSGPASRALELFNPPADALYDIDMAARLSDLPRHTILVCCKYRLVRPTADSFASGYQFSGDTIHALRRVAALREVCGNNFLGIKIILELMNRLEQMHSELQMFRESANLPRRTSSPQKSSKTSNPLSFSLPKSLVT